MYSYKMGFSNMSSSDIVNCIGLVPLATHRNYNDIVFILYKLINDLIDCPELFYYKLVLKSLLLILEIH